MPYTHSGDDAASLVLACTLGSVLALPLAIRACQRRSSRWELALLVALLAALTACVLLLSTAEMSLVGFDPFEILGVGEAATRSEIKKAFRALSLRFHPDKPGGDAARFARLGKAYEALTDKVGAENYRLHGHPDGRQSLRVGVALPTWLLEGGPAVLAGAVALGALLLAPLVSHLGQASRARTARSDLVKDLGKFRRSCPLSNLD